MYLIALIALGWAIGEVYRDVSGKRRASRQQRIADVAGTLPGPMTKGHRRQVAAKHDAAWTAREVLSGFPVTRTAWHSAWLAHKTAAIQHRHKREQARQVHDEAHLGWMKAQPEYRDRRAAIRKDIDDALGAQPDPPRTAKAVREAAGNVIHASFPRHDAPEPSAATAAPVAEPQPGPYAPRPVGGYLREGMYVADQHLARCSDPTCATCLAQIEANEQKAGEWPAGVPHRRKDDPPATAPQQGAVMTMQAEMTYDQSITAADTLIREAEEEIVRLQRRTVGQMVEHLTAAAVDPGNLSHLADVDDAVQKQLAAAQQQLDSAQAFRAGLIRDHGAGAEYHHSAPGGGAEKSFLRE